MLCRALVCALGLAGCVEAQTHNQTRVQSVPTTPRPIVHGDQIPAGTKLLIALDQPIDLSAQVGQRFSARVAQDLVDASGQPVIPQGSEVLGRLVAVRPAMEKEKEPANVDLVIDEMMVRGVSHPIAGKISATTVSTTVKEPALPRGTVLVMQLEHPIDVASMHPTHTAERKSPRKQ
jgi:hypothetical protein